MDFTEPTPCEGNKYCPGIVDMFSKWVEVFPTGKTDVSTVAKVLVREIMMGNSTKIIGSDNGTHVNNAIHH